MAAPGDELEAFDSESFSAIEFVNRLFPNGARRSVSRTRPLPPPTRAAPHATPTRPTPACPRRAGPL
jgi:hypothetical protein